MVTTRNIRHTVKGTPCALLSSLLLLVLAVAVFADIPLKTNYQGKLTDGKGQPLTGSHVLIFRLCDSPTEGTTLWSETKTEVADSSGVFSTLLGSVNPIEIAFTDPCWLEVQVDGEILSPRREVVSVPYAYHAAHADSATTAAVASSAEMLGGLPAAAFADSSVDGHSLDAADGNPKDAVYVDNSGRVGVGTLTPAAFLDVRTSGSTEGGLAPYAEVVGHFEIAGSTAHSAISVDGQAGKDAIVYLAEDGEAVWDVRNDADVGNKFQIRHHTSSGGLLRPVTIDTVGSVGIATTSPNGPLQVESNVNINNEGGTNLASRIAPIIIGDGDGTGPCILIDGNQIEQAAPSHELYLNYNSSSDIVLAQGGGNVGIGTTSPDAKLDVAGQVKITGGSPAAGKLLSSDAGGLASWQSLDVEYMVNPHDLENPDASLVYLTGSACLDIMSSSLDHYVWITVPVHVQAKVAGAAQKVKSLRVYYQMAPPSTATITETEVIMVSDTGGTTHLMDDLTERTSQEWTYYTLTDPSPELITGAVTVRLHLYFDNAHAYSRTILGTMVLTTGP